MTLDKFNFGSTVHEIQQLLHEPVGSEPTRNDPNRPESRKTCYFISLSLARLEASNAAEMAAQSIQNAYLGVSIASSSQKLSSKPIARISLSTKLKPSSLPSISCSTWNSGQIPARLSGISPGVFASSSSNLNFYNEPPESESPSLGKVSHHKNLFLEQIGF